MSKSAGRGACVEVLQGPWHGSYLCAVHCCGAFAGAALCRAWAVPGSGLGAVQALRAAAELSLRPPAGQLLCLRVRLAMYAVLQASLKYELPSCPGILVDVKGDADVVNM